MPISQRTTTLLFGCIAALSAGTNYVYSAYAPQLAVKLSLSSTQTNLIGAAGNAGVYLSGPFIGIAVDRKGPRAVLVFSAITLGVGYLSIRAFYDGGEFGLFNMFGVGGLAFGEFLTGCGSSAALSSAANAVAKSFGSKRRGSAMSLVMSCFGLSAFVYSTLSHASFLGGGDPTSSFLLLLSIGTISSMLLGAVFVKSPVPLPPIGTAYRPLLPSSEEEGRPLTPSTTSSGDISPSESDEEERERRERKDREIIERQLDINGWELVAKGDFWCLFGIMGLLSGTGLMYINNIGTVAATLEPFGSDPVKVAKLQASLVSLLSIFNSLGRLLSGFTSDHFAHHVAEAYRIERVWWLVPMASLFVVSQILAATTGTAEGWAGLALPTAVTGLSYGCLFGLMPVLTLEFFGIHSFSSNNGLISLAPAVFGNSANILFGRIYDSHVPVRLPDLTPLVPRLLKRGASTLAVDKLCLLGKECFASAFHTTIVMTLLAVGLSIILGFRRTRVVKEPSLP